MESAATPLKQMLAFASRFRALGRGRLGIVLLLVLLGSLLEGVGILMLIPLLGLVFGPAASGGGRWQALADLLPAGLGGPGLLGAILGLYVAILAVRGIVAWQRDLQSLGLALDLVNRQRERLVRAVAGASWQQVQDIRHSHIEFVMNTEVERLSIGTDRLLQASVALLQLGLLLALAFWLSPALSAIALAAVLLGLPILLPLVRASHRHGQELSLYGAARQGVFSDFLAGMKLAKAYRAEARYTTDFLEVCRNIRDRGLRYSSMQAISHNAFQFAGGLAAAAIVFVGLYWLDTAPAVIFAMLALMTRIIGPVQNLARSVQDVLTMLPAFEGLSRMEQALAQKPGPADAVDSPGPHGAASLPDGPVDVRIEAVTYCLHHGGRKLLDDVSLAIGSGEIAVLLGPSGTGKTTLADMMVGLVAPDSGRVLVGGLGADAVRGAATARHLAAYVPQESFLFDLTLRENLLWATPGASEADIWQALAMAEAEHFVRGLPNGLDTSLGNRGARLSGGERQRICLARALLGNPGLLILDEATSALDPEVELRLLDTIGNLRGKMTVLIIAHRLPESFVADRILTLQHGQVA